MCISDNDELAYSIEDLFSETSALSNFLKNKSDVLLINNKQYAFNNNHYVKSSSDMVNEQGELNGLIFYYKIPINNSDGHKLIDSVIGIYTFNSRFANDKKVRKIEENFVTILKMFKNRMQIELSLHIIMDILG